MIIVEIARFIIQEYAMLVLNNISRMQQQQFAAQQQQQQQQMVDLPKTPIDAQSNTLGLGKNTADSAY